MQKRKKKKPFIPSEKLLKAAKLFAEDEFIEQTEAASMICVNRSTLWRWRQHPEFVRLCDQERKKALIEQKDEIAALFKTWRKEARQRNRELEKKMQEHDRRNARKKREELAQWLREQNAPEDVIEEALNQLKNKKKRATPEG